MTYQLKLSSKNQVTIPVAVLKDLGLLEKTSSPIGKTKSSKKSTYLVLSKNFKGEYELINPRSTMVNVKGSLKVPDHLQGLTDEQLNKAVEKGKVEYLKTKYGSKNL